MKWFKHDSDANADAKLQNVLIDYGLEGYGLYWYCIELIARRVDAENINFELEHDARLIARAVGSSAQKVTEMMNCFVKLGLFESSGGTVTCLKLARRLDKSMTSNKNMREIINALRDGDVPALPEPDQVQTEIDTSDSTSNIGGSAELVTESEKVMQEETRVDENRINKKTTTSFDVEKCFIDFWSDYPVKIGKAAAKTKFKAKCKNHKTFLFIMHGLTEYNLLWKMIGKTDSFIPNPPHPTTWLNQERWNDEIQKPTPKTSIGATTSYRHLHDQALCDYCETIKVHHHGKTKYELYQAMEEKLKKLNQ